MNNSSRIRSIAFLVGGALMVVGAGLYCFLVAQRVTCWIFALGAILFAVTQIIEPCPADTVTVRRLKRIMDLADLLFIVAAVLMVDTQYMFLRGLFGSEIDYLQIVYNKWMPLLLIAALIEIYTIHRIGSEMKKQE